MELGRFVDGRILDYDGTTGSFAIGEAPVTVGQVAGFSRAGQVAAVTAAATPADTGGGMAVKVVLASILVLSLLAGAERLKVIGP